MKDKFANIIISFITLAMIAVIIVFGIIIFNEVQEIQVSGNPEIDFNPKEQVGNFSNNNATINNSEENETVNNEIAKNPINEVSTPSTSNNTNTSLNRYYYKQLEDESKTIYNALINNKENMKNGTYRINLGNDFDTLLNTSTGEDQLGKYYQSAIEAFNYDNPDIFYLDCNKLYLNIETTTRGEQKSFNIYINSGEQPNYFLDEYTSEEQVREAIQQVEQIKNQLVSRKTGNTYEDIKMVHDYLIDTIEYDKSLSKSNIYNIYGALINKTAVCEGYARAFKYILDGMNIETQIIIGKGQNSEGNIENHAWNYVSLNNTWYAVDCTWDDPIIIGGELSEEDKHKYFLEGANEFLKDHIESTQFTDGGKVFKYPILNGDRYNQT